MARGPILKPYLFCVATRRERFSVGFKAVDDAAALAHASRWLANNPVDEDGTSRVIGPDGRDVARVQPTAGLDMAGAVPATPDCGVGR